jgi:hypothetical protein
VLGWGYFLVKAYISIPSNNFKFSRKIFYKILYGTRLYTSLVCISILIHRYMKYRWLYNKEGWVKQKLRELEKLLLIDKIKNGRL